MSELFLVCFYFPLYIPEYFSISASPASEPLFMYSQYPP
jgi:hypothetical protein